MIEEAVDGDSRPLRVSSNVIPFLSVAERPDNLNR
jgi:hypothetical protein